jgi:CoA:oxalate CoA-transferase
MEMFFALINAPKLLTDTRFVTNAERVENHVELATLISEHLRQRNSRDWFEALDDVGIPASPVQTHDSALSDPQTLAQEMVAYVHHPIAGDGQVLGIPIKLSATPGRVQTPAPTLGQHTDEIRAKIA